MAHTNDIAYKKHRRCYTST